MSLAPLAPGLTQSSVASRICIGEITFGDEIRKACHAALVRPESEQRAAYRWVLAAMRGALFWGGTGRLWIAGAVRWTARRPGTRPSAGREEWCAVADGAASKVGSEAGRSRRCLA